MPLIDEKSGQLFRTGSTSTGGRFPNHRERKKSSSSSGTGLPPGGVAGDHLVKQSGTDGDADWITPGGSVIDLTVAEAIDLIDNLEVVTGQKYRITDPTWADHVLIAGTSEESFGSSGVGFFWNPDYTLNQSSDPLGVIYDDVWVKNTTDPGRYLAGDFAFYDNLVWNNDTGVNTDVPPPSDGVNWSAAPVDESNNYLLTPSPVSYNVQFDFFLGLGVLKRAETLNSNEVYWDLFYSVTNGFANNIERFKWGTDLNGDLNNHAHTGLLDNVNARHQQKGIYINNAGRITITEMGFCQGSWVLSAQAVISENAAFTESYIAGVASTIAISGSADIGYSRFSGQCNVTASGTCQLIDCNYRGGTGHVISGDASLRASDVVGSCTFGTGSVFESSQVNTRPGESHDYTGQSHSGTYIGTDYSGRSIALALSGGGGNELDVGTPATRMAGDIEVTGTGTLDEIVNVNEGCRRIVVRPAAGTTLTIAKASGVNVNLRAADPASIALDGTNKDFAVLIKSDPGAGFYYVDSYFIN